MTTIDRPDMNAELEGRLRSWMTATSAPDLTELYGTVVSSTRTAPQRRRLLVPAANRRSTAVSDRWLTGRRLGIVAAAAVVLSAAVVAGLLIGARLLHNGRLPGVFRATGDIPMLAARLDRPAIAVLPDGRILFAGAGESLLASVIFDPATETYGQPTFDSVFRRGATATTLQNGLVLLTGGEFGQSDAASVTASLFDPASGTVAETSHLNVARSDHTATPLDDGRVLIAGGRHYPGTGSPAVNEYVVALDSVEIYDPSTGGFTEIGPMHVPRAGHTATRLPDGTVLIAGGYTTTPTGRKSMAAAAEIFDPATGTFRLIGSMVTPRGHHSATLLHDGRVLVVGGADRFGPRGEQVGFTASAEVFDPATEGFVAAGPLVTERAGHSATLLPDGRVLVVGGMNERGGPRTTEVFDPETGRFEPGPTAATEHHAGIAPLLAGGRILAAGFGAGGSEVFDPGQIGDPADVATARPTGVGAFSPVSSSITRLGSTAIRLRDGRVLIGGDDTSSGDGSVTTLEIFDPATGTTVPAGTMPPSADPMTVLPDGRVLFITYGLGMSPAASYYDPASATSRSAIALTKALELGELKGVSSPDAGSLIISDGTGSLVAVDPATGETGRPIRACDTPLGVVPLDEHRVLIPCGNADALVVDLDRRTTEPIGSRIERGIRLGDGRVALINPGFGQNGEVSRVVGVYDPASRMLASVAVDLPAGTLIAGDGSSLFVVGRTDEVPSDRAVRIDPTTGAVRDVGPMLGQRTSPGAIALADGRILIIGGARVSPDRTVPIPPAAEVFDPSRIP